MNLLMSWRAIAIIAATVLIAVGAIWAWRTFSDAQKRLENVSRLTTRLSENIDALTEESPDLDTLDALDGVLVAIKSELEGARQTLGPILAVAPYITWLPVVGDDVSALRPLLDVSLVTVDVGITLSRGVKEALSQAPFLVATQTQPGESVTRLLDPLRRDLLQSKNRLTAAQETLQGVPLEGLRPQLRVITKKLTQALEQASPLVEEGLEVVDIAYGLTGIHGRRRYLIAAQNADELRATGGFIPGAWLITFDGGRMQPMVFYDSPDVDDLSKQCPSPPEWLGKSLWGGVWVFRNAFWFPHFPDSARAAKELFLLGQGTEVDGVIGLDQWVLPTLVEALGEIPISGSTEQLTADNVLELVRQGTDKQGRSYLNLIMRGLLQKVSEDMNRTPLDDVMVVAKRMLDEKHLLVYLQDQNAQAKVLARNWGGALQEGAEDYLLVADSNVGYNKVNSNVKQSIEYRVFMDEAN